MRSCLQSQALPVLRTPLIAGIGVESTGHCHPRVVKAIQEQAAQFIHAQQNIFASNVAQVSIVNTLQHVASRAACPYPLIARTLPTPELVCIGTSNC